MTLSLPTNKMEESTAVVIYKNGRIVSGTCIETTAKSYSERQKLLVKMQGTTLCRQILMLICCWYILLVTVGMAPALGVIYVEFIEVFEAPRAQAALVQSLYTGLAVGGGLLFSGAITRLGPGRSVMVSTVIGTAAVLATSFATNMLTAIMLTGATAGLAMSVNLLGGYVAVSWVFTTRRKTALAVLTTGPSIGQTLLPYFTSALIGEYNWRGALMILSGLTLSCLPCALLLYIANLQPPENESKTEYELGTNRRCPCANLSDLTFILFLITYAVNNGTGTVEMWFIYDLSIMRGIEKDNASLLLSSLGAMGLLGRILGALLHRYLPSIRPAVHLIYALLTFGISHYIVVYFNDFSGMLCGVVLRGLSFGIIMTMLPGVQLEMRGIHRYPVTAAICNLANGVGLIAGGFIGGTIADETGTYDVAFYIAAIVGGASALSLCIIRYLMKIEGSRLDQDGGYARMSPRKDDINNKVGPALD